MISLNKIFLKTRKLAVYFNISNYLYDSMFFVKKEKKKEGKPFKNPNSSLSYDVLKHTIKFVFIS